MTDIEKIKTFIIFQDLQLKSFKQQLNEKGLATMLYLQDVCRNWTVAEILDLITKLFCKPNKAVATTDGDINTSC